MRHIRAANIATENNQYYIQDCVCSHTYLTSVAYPRILFGGGGSTNSVEDREWGSGGGSPPPPTS